MTIEEARKKAFSKTKQQKSYFGSIISRTLTSVILVLSVLIVVNTSQKSEEFIKKNVFTTNYNFAYLNKIYNKYFLDILDNTKKSVAVFDEGPKQNYEAYLNGAKLKTTPGSNVSLISSGIVVFIGDKKEYKNTVIIQGSNGIDYWYSNMEKINVKLYDYLEKGETIGTSSSELYYVFQKNGEYLDYKKILENK